MCHAPVSQAADEKALIGKAAPDIVLPKSDGTSEHVVGSSLGLKTILIFWATWCPHCYEELGDLSTHIDRIQYQGIKVKLVDLGESQEDVKQYFDKRHMKLVSFVDANSDLQGLYHLIGVPTIVFIDEKGMVCDIIHQFPLDYTNYFTP
jgi:peroxiredoxin